MDIIRQLKEVSLSVLPIGFFALVLSAVTGVMSGAEAMRFIISCLLVIIGLTIFLTGVETGITPLGSRIGATLTKSRSLIIMLLAAVLLGFFVAPNKFYVLTFAAMGFYILGIEAVWRWLAKRHEMNKRHLVFWIAKYVVFNIVYIPIVILFRDMLFAQAVSDTMLLIVIAGGQIGLFVYDRAYDYVQAHIWGKMRGRFL